MPRAKWKGPYFALSLLTKVNRIAKTGLPQKEPIKTWSRASTIIPQFVGYKFAIHNGKNFIPIHIKDDMIGHKFGEFADTRKRVIHAVRVISLLEKRVSKNA
eukprot:TRINITY_DN8814_c0_g1_i1.p1 TRINITY_DN8814_c0_g1~~TRINITY_DN8814_c0_g1_i1.p1  ORF type:complete len:102 (+),score=14.53 TRINITY_DN8814_c0_g1_i1:91-396(+)